MGMCMITIRGVHGALLLVCHALCMIKSSPCHAHLSMPRHDCNSTFSSDYDLGECMQDELRPISCTGHDSQGGIAITLIDALDSLIMFGQINSLRHAVWWIGQHLDFNVDARVHVFELTIRALGESMRLCVMLLKQLPTKMYVPCSVCTASSMRCLRADDIVCNKVLPFML